MSDEGKLNPHEIYGRPQPRHPERLPEPARQEPPREPMPQWLWYVRAVIVLIVLALVGAWVRREGGAWWCWGFGLLIGFVWGQHQGAEHGRKEVNDLWERVNPAEQAWASWESACGRL